MAITSFSRTMTFPDSTPLLSEPEQLRARAWEEGYLCFRQLVAPDKILNVRRQVLAVAERFDLLHPDHPAEAAITRPGARLQEGSEGLWEAYYGEILRMRDFHALALDASIVRMLEILFDGPVLPHARNILRFMIPGNNTHTTPPHQDYIHIGGTTNFWTVWMPLGDCPDEQGGLAVLPQSHKRGVLPTVKAQGAGGAGVVVPDDLEWATGAMQTGDLLVFHSHNVHQGRDNFTERARISTDFRYQPLNESVRADSMQPHWGRWTWDELYEDWDAGDPVKYYWKPWKLKIASKS